jgi:glyoxylase-like metal-dependent hydrolase (beta-lactamase superfamily II)
MIKSVIPLEVTFNSYGRNVTIYPTLISGNSLFLADTGFPGMADSIILAAEKNGYSLNNLTGIIITHHDWDHIGSLYELKKRYITPKIYSSALEADYINGKNKFIQLEREEKNYNDLPGDKKPGNLALRRALESIPKSEVDIIIDDNDPRLLESGIRIINTPGHKPGHICIYIDELKILIAGDALRVENNELLGANPVFTVDMDKAKKSIKKLLNYEIDSIICYHGGIFKGDCRKAILNILSEG